MQKYFDKAIAWEWAKVGMGQGVGRAIGLAYIYMALPFILAIFGLLWQACMDVNAVLSSSDSRLLAEPTALIGAIFAVLVFGVFYVGFGTVLGVFPAALLGMVSGGIIGAILALPHIAPYRWNRLAVGIGTGLVLAGLINQAGMGMFLTQAEEGMGAYLFFIMGPSLFYLGFCAWLSDQLPILVANHHYPREFPVRERLPKYVITE